MPPKITSASPVFIRSDYIILLGSVLAVVMAGFTRYIWQGDVPAFVCSALAVALLAALVGRAVDAVGRPVWPWRHRCFAVSVGQPSGIVHCLVCTQGRFGGGSPGGSDWLYIGQLAFGFGPVLFGWRAQIWHPTTRFGACEVNNRFDGAVGGCHDIAIAGFLCAYACLAA